VGKEPRREAVGLEAPTFEGFQRNSFCSILIPESTNLDCLMVVRHDAHPSKTRTTKSFTHSKSSVRERIYWYAPVYKSYPADPALARSEQRKHHQAPTSWKLTSWKLTSLAMSTK
jgi:hypothetical protein